jgi:hypothetical protein
LPSRATFLIAVRNIKGCQGEEGRQKEEEEGGRPASFSVLFGDSFACKYDNPDTDRYCCFESVMIGPYIHSVNDDITHINFDHMKQFAKLALGFAVELGHYKGEKN